MQYLRGTVNLHLPFKKGGLKQLFHYLDADCAGNINNCKYASGYLFQKSGAAVSWRRKKQACVALSTAESEYIYMAVVTTAQQAVWMRQPATNLKLCEFSCHVVVHQMAIYVWTGSIQTQFVSEKDHIA